MRAVFKYTRDCKKIFPTTMLGYLVNKNSYATAVDMEDIFSIKCNICILHLEEYLIQDIYDDNCQNVC